LGLTTLFVSHDLNVVRLLTDRVAVMYLGQVVEVGVSSQVFEQPAHPYTQALLSSIPGHGPRIRLSGEISSPIDPPPQVCRFASRCPAVHSRCHSVAPSLEAALEAAPGLAAGATVHQAACHVARWPAAAAAAVATP
jgi:oligopeptide/dipeptide ABC transporter ATP-binding protein